MAWVCTKCGNDRPEVDAARPSLDDRYAVGHCSCTPPPNTQLKPGQIKLPNWQTVPLIRADRWDPAVVDERRRKAREDKLLNAWREGGKLTADEKVECSAIIARHRSDARARGNAEA
jgi:hypothetical protein